MLNSDDCIARTHCLSSHLPQTTLGALNEFNGISLVGCGTSVNNGHRLVYTGYRELRIRTIVYNVT